MEQRPLTKEEYFAEITAEMLGTYKQKNHDYGDCFSTLFCELGMPYAYGHLKEKLYRVKSLMRDEAKVKGESMADSLLDLANYAILTLLELKEPSSEFTLETVDGGYIMTKKKNYLKNQPTIVTSVVQTEDK